MILALVEGLGRDLRKKLQNMLYALGFVSRVLTQTFYFFTQKSARKVLTMQILFTGVDALSIISILGISLGAVIIIQGITLLPQFGQGQLIYAILITIITRELGPVLTSFIVTARSGTAISAELGNMVVSHEIEAYISTGIDPIAYLAVPRFIGVVVSIVLLNFYFNFFGLFGSFIVAQFVKPIPFVDYFSYLLAELRPVDILSSSVKCLVFGALTAIGALYFGFNVKHATTEIPQMTIKAVSWGFVSCIVADAILTLIYYL